MYLATVVSSLAATILLIAPVGLHRLAFRRHKLRTLVSAAHRFAYAGLLLLGTALTGPWSCSGQCWVRRLPSWPVS